MPNNISESKINVKIKAAIDGLQEIRAFSQEIEKLRDSLRGTREDLKLSFRPPINAGAISGAYRDARNASFNYKRAVLSDFSDLERAYKQSPDSLARAIRGRQTFFSQLFEKDPFLTAKTIPLSQVGQELERFNAAARAGGDLLKNYRSAFYAVAPALLQFGSAGRTAFSALSGLTAGTRGLIGLFGVLAVAVPVAAISKLTSSIVGATATFLRFGIEAENAFRKAQIGIASIITSLFDVTTAKGEPVEGIEKFRASLTEASSLLERIQLIAARTSATSEQLATVFQTLAGAGAAAGLSLEQMLNLLPGFTAAGQAMLPEMRYLNEEVRNLVGGTATAQTLFAQRLFGSPSEANRQIKAAREAGQLYELLKSKLEPFNLALTESGRLLDVQTTNLRDLAQIGSRRVLGPLYDDVVTALRNFNQQFTGIITKSRDELKGDAIFGPLIDYIDNLIKPNFQILLELARGLGGKLVQGLTGARSELTAFFAAYKDAFLNLIGLVKQFGELIVAAVTAFTGAASGAEALRRVLSAVTAITLNLNIALAGVRAVLSLITNAVRTIRDYAISIGNTVRDYAGSIVNAPVTLGVRLAQFVPGIGPLAQLLSNFGKPAGGKPPETKPEAAPTGTKPEDAAKTRPAATGFIFKPRGVIKSIEDKGKSAKDDSKDESLRRRLERARLALDLEKDELKNALREFQSLIENNTSELETEFQSNLIALETYFRQKRDLLTQQKRFELDAIAEEERIANQRLKAEFASLGLSPEKGISRAREIQALPPTAAIDTRDLEILRIYNEYQKTTNDLETQRVEKLDALSRSLNQFSQEEDRAIRNFRDSITGISEELSSLLGNDFERAISEIERRFRDLRERLSTEAAANTPLSGEAEVALTQLDRLTDLLERQAQFKRDQVAVEKILQGLATEEERIRLEAVALGRDEYDTGLRIAKVRAEAVERLREIIPALEAAAQSTKLPELVLIVDQLKNKMAELQLVTNKFGQAINEKVRGAFDSFFDSVLQGNESIGESFRRLFGQLLIDIGKVIFKALVLRPLLNFLGLGDATGTKGAGGFFAKILGVGTGAAAGFAAGGIIQGPGTSTSDSILARISNGEAVIPAQMVKNYGEGFISSIIRGTLHPFRLAESGFIGDTKGSGSESGGGIGLRVINVLDPNLLESYMQTAAGERLVLNVIARNGHALRQFLH